MFIGYLKNGFEESLEDLINFNPLFDLELLKKTYSVDTGTLLTINTKTKKLYKEGKAWSINITSPFVKNYKLMML